MGRIQVIDNQTYYSPNAIADAVLNVAEATPFDNNPFVKKTGEYTRTYDDFKSPRLWSEQFGWISFIPTASNLHGSGVSMLMELAKRPIVERVLGANGDSLGYAIGSSCRWPQIEEDLYKAVVTLTKTFHIPCVLPAMPHTYGYRDTFASRALLMTKIGLSREWFMVWLGALGYAVAWLFNPSDKQVRIRSGYPEWRTALENQGLAPSWLDEILHSSICCFHLSVRRAGCILDVAKPIPGQPSIEWLVGHGIPVWYRWGPREEARGREDARFNLLAPRVEQNLGADLQAFHPTNCCGSGTHPEPKVAETCGGQSEALRDVETARTPEGAYCPRVPEWVEFFEARKATDEALRKQATSQQLDVWAARSRDRATSSAKVFVWESTDDDAFLYQRVPVSARWRMDTLDSFSEAQKPPQSHGKWPL